MDNNYIDILKKQCENQSQEEYINSLLRLFATKKIGINICQAEIENIISDVIEKAVNTSKKSVKRHKKKIAEIEFENNYLKDKLKKEQLLQSDDRSVYFDNIMPYYLENYKNLLAQTGCKWVKELKEYEPACDFFADNNELIFNDYRSKIPQIIDDYNLSDEEKKHKLVNLFYQLDEIRIVLPITIDEKTPIEEKILIRNIKAYGDFFISIINALSDLNSSTIQDRDRIYYGLVSKYFSPNTLSTKKQLIWFKTQMKNVDDEAGEKFSRKTLDRYIKAGTQLLASKFKIYIMEKIDENPDVELCLDKIEKYIKNKDVTPDFFLL